MKGSIQRPGRLRGRVVFLCTGTSAIQVGAADRRQFCIGRSDGNPHRFALDRMEGSHDANFGRCEIRFPCGAGNHLTVNRVVGDQFASYLLIQRLDVYVQSSSIPDCFRYKNLDLGSANRILNTQLSQSSSEMYGFVLARQSSMNLSCSSRLKLNQYGDQT